MPNKGKMMAPGTILYSNALRSYNTLDVLASGHFQVSYSKSYLERADGPDWMENYWRLEPQQTLVGLGACKNLSPFSL